MDEWMNKWINDEWWIWMINELNMNDDGWWIDINK